jgi:hypothetical protein
MRKIVTTITLLQVRRRKEEGRMLRVAILLLVAAISTAQAQEGRAIIGPLGVSCGQWVNTQRTADHERLRQWVLGYLSGANMASAGPDFLRDREGDGLTAWIDNYCRRNPLHVITQAIHELLQVLRAGR